MTLEGMLKIEHLAREELEKLQAVLEGRELGARYKNYDEAMEKCRENLEALEGLQRNFGRKHD